MADLGILRPRSTRWSFWGPWRQDALDGAIYQRGRLTVISALEEIDYPDGSGDRGPCWHLSVSRAPGNARPTDRELLLVIVAFGVPAAEEDNHHPGIARHLFCPVDPARRVDCECKVDERVIVEADGYRWTTPRDGPCRGCEYARLSGRPCRQHPPGGPLG